MDEADTLVALAQVVAVAFFEGGAGEDGRFACFQMAADNVVKAVEPGDAVGVGEGDTGGHFGDVFGRVEIVGVVEGAVEVSGEQTADGCLPGT